jgi:fimbrial chaperone protein
MKARLLKAIATCWFASLVGLAVPCAAASLRISPLGVTLLAPQRAGAISITNPSESDMRVQVRVFRWSQQSGKDVFTPTQAIIASPPAALLHGHETYTIRLLRIAPEVAAREESYRLVIDELPPSLGTEDTDRGVQMLLRATVPVFCVTEEAKPRLEWSVWREGDLLHARASNLGNRHARVSDLAITTSAGRISFGPGLNGYVLAGQSQTFEIGISSEVALRTGPATLTAASIDAPVTIETR